MKFGDFRRNFGQVLVPNDCQQLLIAVLRLLLNLSFDTQVIPTPLHVLGRISPISPRFFPFFARFHRLAEAVPTSRKPEPRAKKRRHEDQDPRSRPFIRRPRC